MIVDAHLHVWRSDPAFPDQTATTVSPATDVPLAVLESHMEEHGVDRAVIVQPVYPGEANDYVADCAEAQPNRFRAVCVVDPRHEDAADKLSYWVTERGCRGLRLRPRVPDEAACFGDESTFPLWERIRDLNVVVNVLGSFEHLPTIGRLAERFDDVPIIVDHLAHPPIIDQGGWRSSAASPQSPPGGPSLVPRNATPATRADSIEPLLALAAHEHVYIKLSGFPYFSQQPYPYADCHTLLQRVYDSFGPRRLIWGSDFPHVLLQSGYARARHLLERVWDDLHPDEQTMIMGANALRLYWGEDV